MSMDLPQLQLYGVLQHLDVRLQQDFITKH